MAGSHVNLEPEQVVFGRLKLDRRLDAGGFGEVWLAEDTKLHVSVVLKFLHRGSASTDEEWELLKHELLKLRQLGHPNVVLVHHLHLDDQAAIEMEYLAGGTLLQKLESHPKGFFNVEEIQGWVEQLLLGLDYVHSRGIVHRDLKPRNIMFNAQGVLKLMDFGVARRVNPLTGTPTDIVPAHAFSVYYASPQQIAGGEPAYSDDLYALGVILYQLLTGQLPIYSENRNVAAAMVLRDHPPPLNSRREQCRTIPIPSHLEEVIMRCLEKEPSLRPNGVTTLLSAFQGKEESAAEQREDDFKPPRLKAFPSNRVLDVVVSFQDDYLTISIPENNLFVQERCLVLVDKNQRQRFQRLITGNEAMRAFSAAPERFDPIFPVEDSVIAHQGAAADLLFQTLGNAIYSTDKLRIVATVPYGATPLTRRVLGEVLATMRHHQSIWLIDNPVVAALGSGVALDPGRWYATVYIDALRTEVAITAGMKIRFGESWHCGTEAADDELIRYVKGAHNVTLTKGSAEQVRLKIGHSNTGQEVNSVSVRGRYFSGGFRTVTITTVEVLESYGGVMAGICEAIRRAFDNASPSTNVGPIEVLLTGVGARLRHIDQVVAEETGLSVKIGETSEALLIRGAEVAFSRLTEPETESWAFAT